MTTRARKNLFLSCIFIFLIYSARGQSNILNSENLSEVSIDDYSNEEIRSFYKKALESGLGEQQIYSILAQKGMNQTEISKLRQRLQSIITGRRSNEANRNYADTTGLDKMRYDTSLGSVPIESSKLNTSIFGSELFLTNSTVFEPNLRIPPPPNYMLGPDDEIIVSVYGYSEKKYDLKVNETGSIYIPNVGPIIVAGLTLEQATEKIKNKLASTIYSAIKSGQTNVQVTLGKIKSIRVTVIGQAKKPATYTVSSLTTLFNILYLCGGPSDMGSYRRIEVIRGDEKRFSDLYDFLTYGNQKSNILLREGDIVRIPYYETRVTLSGNVKRPGLYELLTNETFDDLLQYAGGFTDNAYRGSISVERITDSVRQIIDLPSSKFKSFQAKGSDSYIVGKLQDEYGNRIYISGAVQRPGPYELTNGITVKDLITKAGGLSVDAYTQRALIYRYQQNKLPEMMSVNLNSIINNNETFFLKKNDSLVVNSIFNFKDRETISIEGNVRNPGIISWRKNITLLDIIQSAGGISESGDSSHIEVSRRIKDTNVEDVNHIESRIFLIDLKNQNASDIVLRPYDLVIVKEKPGYTEQRTIMVNGAVISPGIYTLEKSGSRISNIMQRINGFKASADSNSLTIRRIKKAVRSNEERRKILERILNIDPDSLSKNQKLRNEIEREYDLISVNLKNVLRNPESSENLQLEDGDILTIERETNLVTVSGEVYFPTIVPFSPKKNSKYYIKQAGNFMPKARKNGTMVIHPNGKVSTVKHFLFFRSYPKVTSRSDVFVPQKEVNNRSKISAAEWAVIISTLSIVSNVIINITK